MDAPVRVTDKAGTTAVWEKAAATDDAVILRLASGDRIEVPASLIEQQADGSYRARLNFDSVVHNAAGATAADATRVTLHEVEEKLYVSTQVREVGRVRARTHVEEETRVVDEPLLRETVTVERVPIGRYVEQAEATRQEGEVTIIPVYEEVLVVEKRLFLKEEVRMIRQRDEVRDPQEVVLRKTHVEVERLPPAPDATTGSSTR